MLEGLDDIVWQQHTSASGEVIALPDLIRNIASQNIYIRGKALSRLYETLWQQGIVSHTATFAVPFLIELVQHPSVHEKDALLVLLAKLATPCRNRDDFRGIENLEPVHGRGTPCGYPRSQIVHGRGAPCGYPRSQIVHGRGAPCGYPPSSWDEAHNAVRAGMCIYLTLLEHRTPKIRMCAAYLVACFPECANSLLPELHKLFKQERNQQVRASLLLSLGKLLEHESEPISLQLLQESVLTQKKEADLVQVAAAMALTRLAGEQTSPIAVHVMVEAIAKPELIAALYDELPWATGSIVSDISALLCTLRPSTAKFAIPTLIEALTHVGMYSAFSLTQALLYLAFNGKRMRENIKLQELTNEQKLVLTAIANSQAVWKFNRMIPMPKMLDLLGGREQQDLLAG